LIPTQRPAKSNLCVVEQAAPMMRLNHKARGNKSKPALLLLHGWASSSQIWSGITESLAEHFSIYMLDLPGHGFNADIQCATVDEFCESFHHDVAPLLPPQYFLLGWSLGGTLASLLASQTSRVKALITVASNPVFVATEQWSEGMSPAVFGQFQQDFHVNAQSALQRFVLLQAHGSATARADMRWIKSHSGGSLSVPPGVSSALQWLAELDVLSCYRDLDIPVMHYLGMHDALVPAALAVQLVDSFSTHKVRCFSYSGHVPFISERPLWLKCIVSDLQPLVKKESDEAGLLRSHAVTVDSHATNNAEIIDKRSVARAFSRAATVYDSIARLQKNVGEGLLKLIDDGQRSSSVGNPFILDLGSGTGYFSRQIKCERDKSSIIELDLSAGMLHQSRRVSCLLKLIEPALVQADFERLPFKEKSFDLIFANLSLQWCSDLASAIQALHALVCDNGVFAFTTVLDGSLQAFRRAGVALDDGPHVNTFCNEEQLLQCVQQSLFGLVEWKVVDHIETFDTVKEMLVSVKGIGAGNHRRDRSPGLMGRARYKKFCEALELTRNTSGQLELNYRILSMVLHREAREGR
jgi:malonyl-CoA O-methyltransferase